MPDEPEVYPPCRCGREVRKLNAASDTPKCVGCGYVEELCRCERQICGYCFSRWPGVVDRFGQHICAEGSK